MEFNTASVTTDGGDVWMKCRLRKKYVTVLITTATARWMTTPAAHVKTVRRDLVTPDHSGCWGPVDVSRVRKPARTSYGGNVQALFCPEVKGKTAKHQILMMTATGKLTKDVKALVASHTKHCVATLVSTFKRNPNTAGGAAMNVYRDSAANRAYVFVLKA